MLWSNAGILIDFPTYWILTDKPIRHFFIHLVRSTKDVNLIVDWLCQLTLVRLLLYVETSIAGGAYKISWA